MFYKALDEVTVAEIEAQGIPSQSAEQIHRKLSQIIRAHGPGSPRTWQCISKQVLSPDLPFSLHQMMYYGCYKNFGSDPPAWLPDLHNASLTNVGQLLERCGKEFLSTTYKDPIQSFSDFQEFSVSNPEVYWKSILEEMGISFSVNPQCILRENSANPGGQWLPGAFLNPAKNCLSVNRKRNLDDCAIIWRNEGEDDLALKKMTLQELRREVWSVAFALDTLGLPKGSAIAIYMPMNVFSVVIYLAIVLSGNVVVSIADSFAPAEIATRMRISNARAIFTQDVIMRGGKSIPLYRKVVDAQSPLAIVLPATESCIRTNLRDSDMSWHDFQERANNSQSDEYVAVEQPVEAFSNILFSSGTTGEPKAIPWAQASPLKAAADAWCHMDIKQGDIVAWPTNLGWMMGPWLVYASLLNNATIALYNGSPLSPGFAKFVQDAKVSMLGVIPSIVRTWKSTNCTAGCDWSSIRCFASTGEASNVDEYLWLMGRAFYKPVIEYCGGTEIGGGFVTGSLSQAQVLSAFSTPAMGCNLFIFGSDGTPIPQNTAGIGELALGPLMLGASSVLLNANHYKVYFEGMPVWDGRILRRHGDFFERTPAGYYRAHGRADDTMNIGGIKFVLDGRLLLLAVEYSSSGGSVVSVLDTSSYHQSYLSWGSLRPQPPYSQESRVSSVEIERICNKVDSNILETAAVGVPPAGGGPEQLVIAVVFRDADSTPDLNSLKMSFNSAVQKQLNPLFRVADIVALPSLPRTATNKVMRRVLRQQFADSNRRTKL